LKNVPGLVVDMCNDLEWYKVVIFGDIVIDQTINKHTHYTQPCPDQYQLHHQGTGTQINIDLVPHAQTNIYLHTVSTCDSLL
jgi:hypothetical protein